MQPAVLDRVTASYACDYQNPRSLRVLGGIALPLHGMTGILQIYDLPRRGHRTDMWFYNLERAGPSARLR
jgi:hypothetical protein